MITTAEALQSLEPSSNWVVRDDVIEWLSDDITQPTQSEIDAEVIRLQAVYDAQEYARDRATEYPTIGDQLDMIYHNGDGGAVFQAAIKTIKDKYPKE